MLGLTQLVGGWECLGGRCPNTPDFTQNCVITKCYILGDTGAAINEVGHE